MTPAEAVALKPDEVHLWVMDLEEPCQEPPDWERILSRDEGERSQRYRFAKDRLHFINRRFVLRQLLGSYTGLDPVSIQYTPNPQGKLSLSSQPLYFNLSKSQGRIVYAITRMGEVGVDLEMVRPLRDLESMAARWFSTQEHAEFLALADESRTEAFYHVWTQKEAFIKAQGEGMKWNLGDFSVCVNPDSPARLLSIKGDTGAALQWQMAGTSCEGGWRVAVCLHTQTSPRLCWYKLDPGRGNIADLV